MDPFGSSSSSSEEEDTQMMSRNFQFLTRIGTWLLDDSSSTAYSTRRYVRRDDHAASHARLWDLYFSESSTYTPEQFHRRFRMSKRLFLQIVNDLENNFEEFETPYDARGVLGFTSLQRCTSAFRQMAYETAPDAFDDLLQMSERTSRESLQYFCDAIVKFYGPEYLRRPTRTDIQRLYAHHDLKHGFPGMIGSIDCTHWPWRNCPREWRGAFTRGDYKMPTIMLEAPASQDCWFWHAFFGPPGSNNDINVLDRSHLFSNYLDGTVPICPFMVNGIQYRFGYYLADGIYPRWATIVKTLSHPNATDTKRQRFKAAQEAARNDIERAFGILKSRWHILVEPARQMHPNRIRKIMYACIILHNMILKDEGRAISPDHVVDPPNTAPVPDNILQQLRNSAIHQTLRNDFIEHLEHRHQEYVAANN